MCTIENQTQQDKSFDTAKKFMRVLAKALSFAVFAASILMIIFVWYVYFTWDYYYHYETYETLDLFGSIIVTVISLMVAAIGLLPFIWPKIKKMKEARAEK